ncbi:MAG TPA: YitT family protein [Bacillota bacterium]|nr:YitT family protein [Bacillota bacterium]
MVCFLKKSSLVFVGAVIQGYAMGLFLFPQSIPSGGAGGLAILLNYFTHLGMGPSLWIFNFLLLLAPMKYLGKRFLVWTLAGATITSFSIDWFENMFYIPDRNLFYDLVVGSLFLGTGIGILMRQGVSNGGAGGLAFMIAQARKILPGKPLFIINCFVFFMTAAIIDWKIIFFALISQWISTRVVNIVYRIDVYQFHTLWNGRKNI